MDTLNAVERDALNKALESPDFSSGLKKFCANMAEKFTVQCRNFAVQSPETVDQQVCRLAKIEQASAKAKAYLQMETAFKRCANGITPDSGEDDF